MKTKQPIVFLFLVLAAVACHPKETTTEVITETVVTNENPENKATKEGQMDRPRYNPSFTRTNDILHTRLEVSFDYKKARMNGKATLDIKPYFYAVNQLELEAKNFDVHKVQLKKNGAMSDLTYDYDGNLMKIKLDREYVKTETYTVYIEYTAKPNERMSGGSAAIAGDKGLYFINNDSSEVDKHVEIWTQGETEANSCWFPTIDKPNEKMTHEILITVRDEFETLSNGLLVKQTKNADGTRTDHWKMNQAHSPYLVMMAIGDFAIVKDKWKKPSGKEIEVAYFVEKEFEQYARDIFGKTPQMLDFFSKRLGVEYPWDKYSQVVVRDYVSGAMENTSATIHGEFLYKTKRELLDGHNESIIAHELFHHWFGDLVTCESWANLPLNESFANYSQFLWDEHAHGAETADHYANSEMNGYIMSSKQNGFADMIRFGYHDKEDMFDAHSYNKGGRILHMLRNYVGDDAFFESLKVYLTENQYQPAEMHQLRLAFEKVTGEDMNWFFNQWFYAKGHPVLDIKQQYDAANGKVMVRIEQKQDFDQVPLYLLPMDIDIYTLTGKFTNSVKVEHRVDTFYFPVKEAPLLVNVDAKKILLCEKEDQKPIEQWVYQYYNAPKYMDRREAISECSKSSNDLAQKVLFDAMSDKSEFLREYALKNLKKALKNHRDAIRTKLIDMAALDKIADVRATAVRQLAKHYEEDKTLISVYEKAVSDSSYEVMAAGLKGISKIDPVKAMELAKKNENEKSSTLLGAIADIYAELGTAEQHEWFLATLKRISGFEKYGFINTYGSYLIRQNDKEVEKGLPVFEDVARNGKPWWLKFSGYTQLGSFLNFYSKRELELTTKAESLRKEGKEMEATQAEKEAMNAKAMGEKISKMLADLKAQETDKNILQFIK